MNNEKKENKRILSPKIYTSQIDITEKPLEQASIILPSSENKQNSNSLQNSSSNIVQMNFNNSIEKSINMSNEEINFSEFNPNTNKLNDIIIPSDENDNKEELEINDLNINNNQNFKNIIKATTIETNKIFGNEDNKNINENKSNNNLNSNIIEKIVQGPGSSKITTTTTTRIYNNNRKIIKQNKKVEKVDNHINNINTNNIDININNDSNNKEKALPNTIIERISKTEIKDENNENNNNLNCNTEPKKEKKNSENEEKNIAKKIIFSNIKYDFDNNSRNEEDEKELLRNKFELIEKTPDADRFTDDNIEEIKKNMPIFNSNLFLDKNENHENNNININNNELKHSIQTLNSVIFGAPKEDNNNYNVLSSNFSFGFKNNLENNLQNPDNKINNGSSNNEKNIFVSFGFSKNEKQNYQPLSDSNIKFGYNQNIIIPNEQKQDDSKNKDINLNINKETEQDKEYYFRKRKRNK